MPTPLIDDSQAKKILKSIGQLHLLRFWDTLTADERLDLLEQIENLDLSQVERLQAALRSVPVSQGQAAPLTAYASSGNPRDFAEGKNQAAKGKCATLVLAGGQGTRLGFEKPKGCFPISLIKKKTLFQLIAEKVVAASLDIDFPLQLAIMCSPLNRDETEKFFQTHHFFGLKPEQVVFFSQQLWPFLDLEGNLFLENPHRIAQGPNGNGGVFKQLEEEGIIDRWHSLGIELVNVIPVDNPLALPIDYELIGFHSRHHCDVTIKATLRKNPQEKVGVVARLNGKPKIIEYYEQQLDHQFNLANVGLFCFSLEFITNVSREILPLHWTKKRAAALEGKLFAWKFEEFIFDVLPFAKTCETLVFPREETFAPLKNLQGEDSIESVRAALLAADRRIYTQITGVQPPKDIEFELAAEFYYPSESLLNRWKGKPLPPLPYIKDQDS